MRTLSKAGLTAFVLCSVWLREDGVWLDVSTLGGLAASSQLGMHFKRKAHRFMGGSELRE